MSKIEWTEETWNPIVGCSLKSPGCTNCYAMKMAGRLEAMGHEAYQGTTQKTKKGFAWTGEVNLSKDALLKPLNRKKPTRYFVNSMSDLFHPDVSDDWIDQIFAIMALCPQHVFQVLTKRPDRMRDYMSSIDDNDGGRLSGFRSAMIEGNAQSIYTKHIEADINVDMWLAVHLPLPNVWLGTSVEDQKRADERIPALLDTPAAVRWLSMEPLLGPVHVGIECLNPPKFIYERGLDWIVLGGESGPGSRPIHPDWARDIRDQCAEYSVPFFFKQWGDWMPHKVLAGGDLGRDVKSGNVRIIHPSGRSTFEISEQDGGINSEIGSRYMARVGKKKSGRLLGGVEHNGYPK